MPKGFSEEKSNKIRKQLLKEAKKLFADYGYKKFGIRQLTGRVGIASGMFYKFFDSKDELFFIVIEDEQKKVQQNIYNEMYKYIADPVRALKQFYYVIIEEINKNPLVKMALMDENYKEIKVKKSKEKLAKERDESLNLYREMISYWEQNELIKEGVNLNLILETLRAIVYLSFHQDEIGKDRYSQVIAFLIDRVCHSIQ